MTEEQEYIPGSCNIGKQEVAYRRNAAIGTFLLTARIAVALFLTGADKGYRLLLILPAAGLGVTFLQWRTKFCIAYAYWGYFSFKEVMKPSRVVNDEFKKLDMIKVRSILLKSLLFGIAIGVIAFLLP